MNRRFNRNSLQPQQNKAKFRALSHFAPIIRSVGFLNISTILPVLLLLLLLCRAGVDIIVCSSTAIPNSCFKISFNEYNFAYLRKWLWIEKDKPPSVQLLIGYTKSSSFAYKVVFVFLFKRDEAMFSSRSLFSIPFSASRKRDATKAWGKGRKYRGNKGNFHIASTRSG